MEKVIEVVDVKIFKEKLEIAEAVLPFASLFLKNKKNVAKLFNIHVNTLSNWIENGTLKENIHYSKEGNKIVFNSMELLKFKVNPKVITEEYKPHNIAKNFFK